MAEVDLERPEIPLEGEVGPFKRIIAVAVVLITLFGAVVAYVQAVESNDEDVAARDAQRDAIDGLGAQVDASAALSADLRIGSDVDVLLQRQALNAARVNAVTGDPDSDVHLAAAQRFAAVAEAIAELTPVDPSDPRSIDDDIASRNESPDAARLRQSVEADLANDHGGKADAYVAVLTVLAVALFLLGLSLTVQGRNRFILAAPGAVIALVCVAWTAFIGGRDITRVSERAIQLAAEGQRFQDAGDLEAAIEAYDEAIDDSPDFAAAYARRASARFVEGSPQEGQQAFLSITSDAALEDALDDLDTALELGAANDVNTVAQAGFFAFLDQDFDRSITLSTQALDLNENLAPVWFNLGVAHVARGDDDEADDAYRAGLRLLDDTPDAGTRSAILAGARTDLSILREILDGDELDDVLDLVERTEVDLATFELATTTCPDGDPCPEVEVDDGSVGDAELSRSGAFVFATIPVEGVEPGDAVAATWYFRRDDQLPFEQAFLSFAAGVVDDDGTVTTSTLPSIDPACPVGGEYLVRLYAGDEFLGEATGTVEPSLLGESFTAFADPIEGFEGCVPEGFDVNRADVSDLDAFTTFGGPDEPFVIGVNVTPGALLADQDAEAFARDLAESVAPGGEPSTIQLFARDVDGNFLFLDGIIAVDEAEGVAVAVALGPDTSARTILLTGDVDEAVLLEVVGAVTFTGVGSSSG